MIVFLAARPNTLKMGRQKKNINKILFVVTFVQQGRCCGELTSPASHAGHVTDKCTANIFITLKCVQVVE